jgi:hypothetical protein
MGGLYGPQMEPLSLAGELGVESGTEHPLSELPLSDESHMSFSYLALGIIQY